MDPGEVDTEGCSPLVRWTLKEMQPGRVGGEGVEAWFSRGWRPSLEPPVASVVDSAAPRTVAGMQ